MTEQQFYEALQEKGFELSDTQKQQFKRYFEVLVEWNEKMNLTAITDAPSVYLKHFYDSITSAFYVDFTKYESVCDVGAGAGFPSIPLKIIYPHLHVTIVDSLNKRITFLNHLAGELKLENVAFVHARAEEFGRNPKYREQFDVVTARAVARLSVLSELCIPLAKQGGLFVSMKGAAASEEMKDATRAVKLLGAVLQNEHEFLLPEENSERHIFVFEKKKQTPKKYPRKPGVPNKTPITAD
ncbi:MULTISPECIES: 16S rRNA (guanine(527)-N(7))-methyltransferase RsmG [unclassified Sporosarcina]|uniref:16S rRNA (guanine(527)-N(7))-methyltransferase RsmG n=1 Tax=unclassified Sporosarcina TaxID=2647733 RepID=UPI000C1628B7|nr:MULTISPECIES: 16S rRNA (guanine(527)-N(7))-methyltransferase RsmG [unclassified Sporosarcina]PIC85698.1 16S rRNA (guanine(527)-N(7))-methyltransferase RsmG [Sporosarcina sp. P20a]PIC99324.1 16S rRNA (guanine(527)-N(7))-methyltransferase RsmG [Sporosarcina sp. P29]PID06367.1 16S rRNA (guanine(527)-N(7))-methyltransferase RsmG [Sporosarcina sp. P30]PID09561.1 16S rRNA (guanine(527)-N(7))-methyltransferase RsmG [Sporosarcina sp. P31]PID12859.1 16S rRNA (guanine(527)-N(7))-methyltransferase Rsm